MKPQLLEESTLEAMPTHVTRLLSSVTSQLRSDATETDLAVAMLYVLMLEAGFTPLGTEEFGFSSENMFDQNFNIKKMRKIKSMPKDWRTSNGSSYAIQFHLNPFREYSCSLVAVCTEHNLVDNLIVNLLVPQLESRGRCVCIHPSKYVTIKDNLTFPPKFQNLKDLAITFKNAVCHPIRSEILETSDVLHSSLSGIPDEVKLRVCALLTVQELAVVAVVSKGLRALTNDQSLWRHFVERDFGSDSVQLDSDERDDFNWKHEYQNRFAAQVQLLRQQERSSYRHAVYDYDDFEDAEDGDFNNYPSSLFKETEVNKFKKHFQL